MFLAPFDARVWGALWGCFFLEQEKITPCLLAAAEWEVALMIWKLASWFAEALGLLIGLTYPTGCVLLTHALTFIGFDLLKIRRKVILRNLEIAFPEKSQQERLRIGRESFAHMLTVLLELCGSKYVYPKLKITYEGTEAMDSVPRDCGIWVLTMHFGNWEAMAYAANKRFRPTYAVMKDVGKGAFKEWIVELRHTFGLRRIHRGKNLPSARKQMGELIKQGFIVGFVVDQRRKNGQILPFFGHNSHTNDSLVQIWLQTPAPIFPNGLVRISPGRYVYKVYPEFKIEHRSTEEETIRHNTLRINQTVEQIVREHPEQYFWVHRRWKGFETVADSGPQVSVEHSPKN